MYSLIACDLDGVVWRGTEAIAGSSEAIAAFQAAGAQVVFVTNNSATSPRDYVAKLASFGIAAAEHDVVTSAIVAAWYLTTTLSSGARLLAVSGTGVIDALRAEGFEVVEPAAIAEEGGNGGAVEAVVVGWHAHFDFERMRIAADAIRGGAMFVATNNDPTYPGAGGSVLPGNGSIVAAIATASGVVPTVIGKPNAPMAAYVRDRYGSSGIMIGDRLSTDGAFAVAMGWPFAHVQSGIVENDAVRLSSGCVPHIVGHDLHEVAQRLLPHVHAKGF